MNDYEIHGGVHTFKGDVNHVEAHGGVYYFNGSVEHFVNHGGVVYDQRPSNRVEYIFDGVKESELNALRMQVSQLQDKYRWAEDQRLRLRAKLDERSEQSEHIPDDDVLIRKIRSLEHELHEEREARKREVAELKERIDVAMEINAKLRRHDDDHNKRDQLIADEHIDILATILAAYPFTPSGDLEFEFGLPEQKIRFVAQTFQSMKSKDARDAAREYLRKQGMNWLTDVVATKENTLIRERSNRWRETDGCWRHSTALWKRQKLRATTRRRSGTCADKREKHIPRKDTHSDSKKMKIRIANNIIDIDSDMVIAPEEISGKMGIERVETLLKDGMNIAIDIFKKHEDIKQVTLDTMTDETRAIIEEAIKTNNQN